jgi:hypothetical protein
MTYLEVFFLLQVLDFMTTLVGLRMGGAEVSPFIGWVMRMTDPVTGLTAVKLLGFGLAGVCLWMQKQRVIRSVNYIFAGIVIWNVYMLLRAVSVGVS